MSDECTEFVNRSSHNKIAIILTICFRVTRFFFFPFDWPLSHLIAKGIHPTVTVQSWYPGYRSPTSWEAFSLCPLMNRRCACNCWVLCKVWLHHTKGQPEQGSSFVIFSGEINITKKCAWSSADHNAEVFSIYLPLAPVTQRNDLVICESSGVPERKWQSWIN